MTEKIEGDIRESSEKKDWEAVRQGATATILERGSYTRGKICNVNWDGNHLAFSISDIARGALHTSPPMGWKTDPDPTREIEYSLDTNLTSPKFDDGKLTFNFPQTGTTAEIKAE